MPVSSMVPYFLVIALLWKSMLSVCHLTTHNINHKEIPKPLMLLQKYSICNQQMYQGKMQSTWTHMFFIVFSHNPPDLQPSTLQKRLRYDVVSRRKKKEKKYGQHKQRVFPHVFTPDLYRLQIRKPMGKFLSKYDHFFLGCMLLPIELKMLQLISLNLVYLLSVDLLVCSSSYSRHNLANPRTLTQNSTLVQQQMVLCWRACCFFIQVTEIVTFFC